MSLFSWFKRSREVAVERKESDDYPALANLMGGYFHQDYDLVSEDPDVIVAVFKQESTRDHVQNVIHDSKRFLDLHDGSDTEFEVSFEETFSPEAGFDGWKGRTRREELMKMIEILSDDEVPGKAAR